ncbi:MAG: beta-lactamase family protein [Spirochaetales bacterium]|nr:beta-lactamase family protein [Spirochaetales bacterium]
MHEAKTDCRPEEVGYNQAAIETLDELARELIDKGFIQSACYLMARHGKVFAHKSAGRLTRAPDSPDFLPDSLRPVASLTKAFTAVAVWQLLERGKIFLHQPVAAFLKEFDTPMHGGITIFQLLTHTSGLRADGGGFLEPYADPWPRMSKSNWIKRLLAGPLQYRPGTVWNYCTKAYLLLAEVVARVSGMDYDRYIEENVWRPLGMTDTHFFLPEEKRGRTGSVEKWNDEQIKATRDKEDILALLGGGAAFSNVGDIFKFGRMLLAGGSYNGRRIVGRKWVEAGVRAHIRNKISYNWQGNMFAGDKLVSYGLGLEIDKHEFMSPGTFDHEGAGGVFLFMDPKEDFLFAGFFASPEWHGESWVSPLAVAWSGLE